MAIVLNASVFARKEKTLIPEINLLVYNIVSLFLAYTQKLLNDNLATGTKEISEKVTLVFRKLDKAVEAFFTAKRCTAGILNEKYTSVGMETSTNKIINKIFLNFLIVLQL